MPDSSPDPAAAPSPGPSGPAAEAVTPTDPRPLQDSLPILLLRAREMVMEYFRPFLAAHDLTDAQWRVLRVLHAGGALEPTEIARRGVVMTPSLTRILQTLEARGLIARSANPDDRRRHIVALTDKAERLIAELAPLSEAGYRKIEARFGAEEVRRLRDLLSEFNAR